LILGDRPNSSKFFRVIITNLDTRKINNIQKIIPTLRNNLNGKFTELQKNIARVIGFYHITYEHSHQNINSSGMLLRNQSWVSYFKILVKYLVKFLPYLFFYHILRLFYSLNQNKNKIDYIYK
jgi:hypothetical protein